MFPSQSPTNTEVDNLINFIRGVDTQDQDAIIIKLKVFINSLTFTIQN